MFALKVSYLTDVFSLRTTYAMQDGNATSSGPYMKFEIQFELGVMAQWLKLDYLR